MSGLHQLRAAYDRQACMFLSNAGYLQIFNVNDIETAGSVSRMRGETTVREPSTAPGNEADEALHLDLHAPTEGRTELPSKREGSSSLESVQCARRFSSGRCFSPRVPLHRSRLQPRAGMPRASQRPSHQVPR